MRKQNRSKRENNKQRKSVEWIKGSEKINQEMENINNKQISQLEIIIFTIDKVKIINEQLEQLYNEDPLQGWEKHKTKVKIELIDENSIITQKPLKYNCDDLKEFKIHIDEQLENNYIQESNSKYTNPTFIVIKHSEQK